MNETLVTVIGWVGQACFFSRFLIQWMASERAGQSVAPRVFWWFSLVGAACLIVFTLHRGDTVFLIGFLLTLAIYARNLFFAEGRETRRVPAAVVVAVALIAGFLLIRFSSLQHASASESVVMLVIGWIGQAIWSSRFVVQWWYTERRGVSHFPAAFWWFSLTGNALLLSYAIHVGVPLYIVGLCVGPIVQVRNLVLLRRERKELDERVAPA